MRDPLIVLIALLAVGCTPRYVPNWSKLQIGMDRLEVYELLGRPTTRRGQVHFPPATRPGDLAGLMFGAALLGTDEWWAYGPEKPFDFGALDNILWPSSQAYVVYFNRNLRVIGWRAPEAKATAPAATTQTAGSPSR